MQVREGLFKVTVKSIIAPGFIAPVVRKLKFTGIVISGLKEVIAALGLSITTAE